MITLRQHLVSLIAVFLALGLGVIAGSTLISPATVHTLNGALNALRNQENQVESQNVALSQQVSAMTQWAAAARDRLVVGTLTGRPTVLLSFDSTPAAETAQMAATLVEAGAHLDASVVLSSNLGLPDDSSRQEVAAALGLTGPAPAVEDGLVTKLADSLSGHAPGALGKLIDAGLAHTDTVPNPANPAALAAAGSDIVILSPVVPALAAGQKVSPDLGKQLILPLAQALTPTSALLAVGEDGSNPLPVLGEIRGDAGVRAVTVDSVDTPMGEANVALGLEDAASGLWGDYGSGPGASVPLPSPAPSPSFSPPTGRPPVTPTPSSTG